MLPITFGTDGLLETMTSDQEVVGCVIGYWDLAKPILYRLNLKPEDLETPWDRLALEAAYALDLRGDAVSFASVLAELRHLDVAHMFTAVGGPAIYLASVAWSVIAPASVAYHARRVIESARLRRATSAAARLLRAARVGGDVDEALQEIARLAK